MIRNGLALAVGISLSGVAGAAVAADPAPAPLAVGQQVRGEITTADALNWRDGTRSKLYSISLAPGQGVEFAVDGPLRGQLTLFSDNHLVQTSSTERDATSMSVRAPESGRYLLAVSGRDASSYGPYTLRVSPLALYDGSEIRAGAAITDWADSARRIPLVIEREAVYAVRMDSDEFDTLLKLEGNGVSLGNDDAEGSNSLVTARLAPGRYTVIADGYGGSIRGQYRLAVSERELPAGVTMAADGVLQPGADITALHEGAQVAYRLQVPSRQLATITMRSSELDSMLALEGADVLLQDDDSGGGLDARIISVLEPGDYSVRASSYNDGAGLFTLSATLAGVPADIGGGTLVVGQPRDARLMAGATDRYTVRIPRNGSYRIEMQSAEGVDSYLRLLRDGQRVAQDDDSGGELNARIEETLQAGDYVLEASSAVGRSEGRYRIAIQRR
ncbi:hypothetical protein E5843_14505 [Luteimonas yindakuii]|uniref:hypothetical protein n=1 Tax=Luteimonas yindakuii TaxID=2565782 RepID=UPI0011079E67|nr:hypothetical protein [Luteimonas yindakuii]QCU72573.1 hypothetical protein E5843_14505 [Luteimonas yindakuii]